MRLRQLDGLRAFAVFLVILTHHQMFSDGWVGVDFFFVLSGFLITGILRHETNSPVFWRSFYIKRVTRILPPVCLLVLLVALTTKHFHANLLAYLLFAGNLIQLTPYAISLLAPLWSLAVEEHFYLFWPFAVKALRRNQLLNLTIAIIAVSPVLRMLGTIVFHRQLGLHPHWDSPIFLLTPFRLDGLASGAALALLLEGGRCPQWLSRWSGLGAIVFAALFFGLEASLKSFHRDVDSIQFNSMGYSLIAADAFFLVSFLVLHPNAFLSRVISSKIPVFLGSISYGIYLFQTVIEGTVAHAFHSAGIPVISPAQILPIDCCLTVAFASLSFFLLEKPVIAWGRRFTGSHLAAKAAQGYV